MAKSLDSVDARPVYLKDQVKSQDVPSHNIMDGKSVPHTVLRATPLDQNHPHSATRPVDRSVIWSHSVDDQPDEEAVMQISGAGHWFLEGWIGDHAVDFLVDRPGSGPDTGGPIGMEGPSVGV